MAETGHIVIAGGSGFLGLSLARHLTALGRTVVILSRNQPPAGSWTFMPWDARTVGSWTSTINSAAAIVNLVGRTVDCVKTPDHCDEIMRSRVESTRVLGMACRSVPNPPRVWVQMSTAHIYGDPPSAICDEDSAFGYGLAPTVGRAWEDAYAHAKPAPTRGVIVRTSFVIGREGGAIPRLATLCRLGLGGRVGSGKQGFSWIHARDMNRIFERAITDPTMEGAYIATAPSPVSNAEFMRQLRRVAGGLGRFGIAPPAFEWMVRLGAPMLMRTDPELAIYGRHCIPKRLLAEGFTFEFSDLRQALDDLFRRT